MSSMNLESPKSFDNGVMTQLIFWAGLGDSWYCKLFFGGQHSHRGVSFFRGGHEHRGAGLGHQGAM